MTRKCLKVTLIKLHSVKYTEIYRWYNSYELNNIKLASMC